MAISEKELPDVVLHGESEGTVFVVPLDINACIFLSLPVGSDRVVFLKCGEEMLCVLFANIFDAKLSTVRQNMTGRHFWSQRPGVVVAS